MKDEANRLFIASPLCGAPRETLNAFLSPQQKACLESGISERVSWVPPENWHLTWHFLGNVSQDGLDALTGRLPEVLANVACQTVYLEKLAFWPSPSRPRLLVWQQDCGQSALRTVKPLDLVERIRSACPDYPPDHRRFIPHITVARIRQDRNPSRNAREEKGSLSEYLCLSPERWDISSVHLYRSLLRPEGAHYESLVEYRLLQDALLNESTTTFQ